MGRCASKYAVAEFADGPVLKRQESWNDHYEKYTRERKQANSRRRSKSTSGAAALAVAPEPTEGVSPERTARRAARMVGFAKEGIRAGTSSMLELAKMPTFMQKDKPKHREVNGYSIVSSLGKGAYGEVFLASRHGESYAIKVLKRPPPRVWHPLKPRHGSTNFSSIKSEVATMKKIHHPNCVEMFDVIIDEGQACIFLVLELVEGGPSQLPPSEDGAPAETLSAEVLHPCTPCMHARCASPRVHPHAHGTCMQCTRRSSGRTRATC